ncbi:MAG: acyltransferase family protein [Mangrovicoccus sp.]
MAEISSGGFFAAPCRFDKSSRANGSIELLRFVGALAIINFHMGYLQPAWSVSALQLFVLLLVFHGVGRALPERAGRLLLPWVFWSAIYAGLFGLQAVLGGAPLGDVFQPWMILAGPSLHLWFLPFGLGFLALCRGLPTLILAPILGLSLLLQLVLPYPTNLSEPFAQWYSVWPMAILGLALPMVQRSWLFAALVGLGFYLLNVLGHFSFALPSMIACFLFALAMAVRLPCTPVIGFLGQISFGMYLVHPIFHAGFERAFDLSGASLFFAIAGASALATAALRPILGPKLI